MDISKFLYMVDNQKYDLNNCTYMQNIIAYLNRLRESRVGPSGQLTKLTTIQNVLKMLLSRIPEAVNNKGVLLFGRRWWTPNCKLQGLAKTLRNECSKIRQKRDMFHVQRGGGQGSGSAVPGEQTPIRTCRELSTEDVGS